MSTIESIIKPQIFYSCYLKISREGEQFISEHVLTFIESGSLTVNDGIKVHELEEGDFAFYSKNNLAKFAKVPSAVTGEFKALSLMIDGQSLKKFANAYGYDQAGKGVPGKPVTKLKSDRVLLAFADSLKAYAENIPQQSDALLNLKVNEALLILMQTNPELAHIMFDFSEPGKIDLKAFMYQNFHFNVSLTRFAYLTGRSLSTFKRDFQKIFETTPNKWLQQIRLKQAHFLISEKGKKPSDVYLEVGFENLSHFSFAFKKAFGVAPSQLLLVEE